MKRVNTVKQKEKEEEQEKREKNCSPFNSE
jgi:hypothetical protein